MRWLAYVAVLSLACGNVAAPDAALPDEPFPTGFEATDAGAIPLKPRDACSLTTAEGASAADGGADGSDGGVTIAASLAALSVAPLTLVPAFSPSVFDYYVRCAAGDNALTVSVAAPDGGTASLVEPVALALGGSGTKTVDVNEGDALVVLGESATASAEYWVRCLPHDFPEVSVVVPGDAGAPAPGYYLVGDTSRAKGEGSYAMVLDGRGVPVWYSTTSTGREPVDVESLAPNTVSFVPFLDYTFATTSGAFEVHALGTKEVRRVEPEESPLDLHELRLLPNGDSLVLSDPIATGVDLTGLGSFGANEAVVSCVIQEVTPCGEAVWTWSAADHFDPVTSSTYPDTEPVGSVEVVDPFHCNAIDVAENGDVLVSARNMDAVFMVSRTDGTVLWKLGGTSSSKDAARFLSVVNDPLVSFYRQHDARLLPNGQLSLFDDHTAMPGVARAVVYSLDVTSGTATLAWEYRGAMMSASMGSFRLLLDGSRVIGWGEGGVPGLAMTEVDEAGDDLLEVHFTDDDQSYRATKVPTSQLDLGVMRRALGGG